VEVAILVKEVINLSVGGVCWGGGSVVGRMAGNCEARGELGRRRRSDGVHEWDKHVGKREGEKVVWLIEMEVIRGAKYARISWKSLGKRGNEA
jgi:hypothetical protein